MWRDHTLANALTILGTAALRTGRALPSVLVSLAALCVSWPTVAVNGTVETATVGGPGGISQAIFCSKDFYLAGLNLKKGAWLDNVRGICYLPDQSGRWIHAASSLTIQIGGDGGNTQDSVFCPDNMWVNGVQVATVRRMEVVGTVQRFVYVSDIKVNCIDIRTGRMQLMGGHSAPRSSGPQNRYQPYQWIVCPQGMAARGFRGGAGAYVDRFGLLCSPFSVSDARVGDNLKTKSFPGPAKPFPSRTVPTSPDAAGRTVPRAPGAAIRTVPRSPDAASRTIPQSAELPGRIFSQGTSVLGRMWALDLDSGQEMFLDGRVNVPPSSNPDVWFAAETSQAGSFSRLNALGSALSSGNSDRPSPQHCATNVHPRNILIDLARTAGGTWFCYKTSQGRFGRMRLSTVAVAGDPIGHLKIEFTTWDK